MTGTREVFLVKACEYMIKIYRCSFLYFVYKIYVYLLFFFIMANSHLPFTVQEIVSYDVHKDPFYSTAIPHNINRRFRQVYIRPMATFGKLIHKCKQNFLQRID